MHITSLHSYPIKGCRGHALTSATIDVLGFAGDRRLMLVDAEDRFLSQREAPELATIEPHLDGPMLEVRVAGHESLHLELDPRGALRQVELWKDSITATDQGDHAAAWFSDVLGRPCRLVQFGIAATRPLDPTYSPRADAETAFSDGYPVLAMLQESLDDLNGRLTLPVPMGRFRPNIVLRGASAWSEDDWTALAFGPLTMDAVKPCARCLVPTTDQATGAQHPQQEPLRTLATFRTIPGRGVLFGMNLVPRGVGEVRVGDDVVSHES
jgi:uncharacterized protein